MIYGAITNSWRMQLENADLMELIGQAQTQGARHIELRQTCLGRAEQGEGDDWRPELDYLAGVVQAYPELSFDLAMAYPVLTRDNDPQDGAFQAALAGARLVGGAAPQLRVVDLAPNDAVWQTPDDIPAAARSLAGLAAEAARQGVTLSMENAALPIGSMALLVETVRGDLPAEFRGYLGLCPDPTNQLRQRPDSQPLADLEALPPDLIKLVHFKQLRGGQPHPTVDDGDLDCHRMRQILQAKGYAGPAIMEIPPHPEVFANLAASFAYLG